MPKSLNVPLLNLKCLRLLLVIVVDKYNSFFFCFILAVKFKFLKHNFESHSLCTFNGRLKEINNYKIWRQVCGICSYQIVCAEISGSLVTDFNPKGKFRSHATAICYLIFHTQRNNILINVAH
jgi:hypothetical protein